VVGFVNVLEGCRQTGVRHLLYASSSSVYGANARVPFSEHDSVDHPISLYAATKKAGELLAHSYSHLYRLPVTGLRLFTVYGPWGRPDMALWRFAEAILAGQPIDVYNAGQMKRDFTYVDDVVEGILRLMKLQPGPNPHWTANAPDPATSNAPYRLYNIGNNQPVELDELISLLERYLGRKAIRNLLPMQPGDVPATFANVDDLANATGFRPLTPIAEGVRRFVDWYCKYHGLPQPGEAAVASWTGATADNRRALERS
jgi:UDP-glucuronate 4-epimerase